MFSPMFLKRYADLWPLSVHHSPRHAASATGTMCTAEDGIRSVRMDVRTQTTSAAQCKKAHMPQWLHVPQAASRLRVDPCQAKRREPRSPGHCFAAGLAQLRLHQGENQAECVAEHAPGDCLCEPSAPCRSAHSTWSARQWSNSRPLAQHWTQGRHQPVWSRETLRDHFCRREYPRSD
jgi:hypothetical protein